MQLKLSKVDKENYKSFKEQQVKSFNKKRLIEKNTIEIKQEFSALKNRIKAGNESYRQIFKKKATTCTNSSLGSKIIIPQSAIQRIQQPSNLSKKVSNLTSIERANEDMTYIKKMAA